MKKEIEAWAVVADNKVVLPKTDIGYEPFEIYPFKWQAVGASFKWERVIRVEIREVKK